VDEPASGTGDWFDYRWLFGSTGSIPSAETEEQYYAVAAIIDMAA